MKAVWIAPVMAATLLGCVSSIDREIAPAPSDTTPQQIVSARQAAFHMSAAAMGNMNAAIERGADPSGQAFAARGVSRWARALPAMFPESTAAVTPTRARPEIWANKADFTTKAADYAAAATRLAEAAQANDKAAFAAEFKATRATCSACHDLYQVPQNPGG